MNDITQKLVSNPHFESSIRGDNEKEVKTLFKQAQKRREDKVRIQLLRDLLNGKVIDLTQSKQLYEAVNRERMDFEEIMKLHPDQVAETITYVKQRREEQGGKWYNLKSQACWGEKGAIPPCVYYARPQEYWNDRAISNEFYNMFPKFRIAERPL
jgi:hypothetical protein